MKKKIHDRICCVLFLVIVLICVGCTKKDTDVKTDEQAVAEQSETEQTLEERQTEGEEEILSVTEPEKEWEVFPKVIEGGKLTIESIFQYSGINFDCNEEMCEEIGSLQLKNTSAEYLEYADIEVKLTGDIEFHFRVEDVPAGQSIMAFDTENRSYEEEQLIEDVIVDAVWRQSVSSGREKINFVTEGTMITVTNVSDEAVQNMTVKYHCSLDGIYLGGKSYEGIVESLNPQESITLEAVECYLGEAAVIDIIF